MTAIAFGCGSRTPLDGDGTGNADPTAGTAGNGAGTSTGGGGTGGASPTGGLGVGGGTSTGGMGAGGGPAGGAGGGGASGSSGGGAGGGAGSASNWHFSVAMNHALSTGVSFPYVAVVGDVTGDRRDDVIIVSERVDVFVQKSDGTLATPQVYAHAPTPSGSRTYHAAL